MPKKHGFTGIFTYLYSLKSEFLPSNCQTQENPANTVFLTFQGFWKIK
ncbi:hypothetical protein R7V47_01405 [Mesomycoplasma ovipneumoniae]|nr:hypothetical protein [Mesomycoplasma ovipneumoniae]MDW2907664.1 hypothetical protein [Mesomycoplasma ovipneumoniae]